MRGDNCVAKQVERGGEEDMDFSLNIKDAHCVPRDSVVKNLPANTRDAGLIPGSGRSPEGRHGNPLQYSCLENPMDRGTWLKESDTTEQLSTFQVL